MKRSEMVIKIGNQIRVWADGYFVGEREDQAYMAADAILRHIEDDGMIPPFPPIEPRILGTGIGVIEGAGWEPEDKV